MSSLNSFLVSEEDKGEEHQVTFNRKYSMQYARLLDEEEINRVMDRFTDDTEAMLEEAIRKREEFKQSKVRVPWYLWVLIGIFAIDDILDWIHTPLILYPLILVIGVYLGLQYLGMQSVVF